MTTQLDTSNRKAFDLVADALEILDQYRASHDIRNLNDASVKLSSAIELDPLYFRAKYYDAIVDDLAGRFGAAVQKLEPLLKVASPIQNEIRYNLALAEYHGYNHEALDKAIEQFQLVLKSKPTVALSLRATAGLAQAYAMHMIPKEPTEPDKDAIEKFRQLTMECAEKVRRMIHNANALSWLPKAPVDGSTVAEVSWTIHNAKGMALMYYSDYVLFGVASPSEKQLAMPLDLSIEALKELQQAEGLKADDWANHCDMASANMRIGYWSNEAGYMERALVLLQDVIDRLRPGYPFAKYEMGRVNRLAGRFDIAADLFGAVLKVSKEERDIGDTRLNIELNRACSRDSSFP